jgi:predicted secreted protein
MRHLLVLPLVFFSLAAPLNAQDINYNQISLTAAASQEVANDVMNARLIVQENGAKPSQLSQRVNTRMTKILAIVERSADIKAQTTNYNTQPRYKNGKITGWQVTQSLNLNSENIDQLTTLLAKLNELAHIQSMTFSVSDSLREQTKQTLTKAAIKQFRDKAQVITEQFDKTTYQLVHASVDTNSNDYTPKHMMMERMAVADAVSAPAVSAGTNKITVTVNGSIELSD